MAGFRPDGYRRAPLAGISSGAFVGYDWPLGGSKQVAYVDDNGHIQELFLTQGGTWSVADLTSIAGAPLANISIGAIAGYAWSQGGTKQVVYVDDNGHIQELVVQHGGAWSGADLTSIAGAPPAISTAIVGYDWAQSGSKQVAYVDGNGHIQELVVQQGQSWSVADLSAIAGAPPANISNGGIAGAPLDLVWDTFDDNEIPMSPKWRSQKMSLGLGPAISSVLTAPNPAQVCPTLDATCTTQNPTKDVPGSGSLTDTICSLGGTNTFGIDGHLNWFAATYDGSIIWDNHSNPIKDDDYNFKLSSASGAGLTRASNGFIGLEFQAAETIDHFHTPWWDSFHKAVDQSDAAALQMVNGQYAIVTGLLGLDCCHSGNTELHPVWAMAIRVEDTFPNQRWAIFVRNWGNEGFCSSGQHLLERQSFTFRLPWPAGASSVSVLNSTFLTNNSQVTGPGIEFAPNEGVRVWFTLPAPEAGARVNGELTLQGQFPPGAQKPLEAQLTLSSPIAKEDQVNSPEAQFDALLAKMTPTQRQTFLAQFPAESPSEDAIVLPQVKAVQVPHLPAKVVTSQLPLVRSVVDDQEVKRTQLVSEALRTAFGGQIPRL